MWFTDIDGALINSKMVAEIRVKQGAEFFRVMATIVSGANYKEAILYQTMIEDEAIDYMDKLYKKLSVID